MRTFEYIIKIAEEKSLLRAAKKLYISSSALSQAVSRLEADLKTPLFIRSKSGWYPTAAGEIYIDMAKNILDLQRRAYTEISLVSGSVASNITMGVSAGHMTEMFSDIFPIFNTRFPNIKITLTGSVVFDIISQLKGQQIDLGFIAAAFDIPDLQTYPLGSEHFLIVVPRNHPLSHANGTRIPAFSKVPLNRFRDCEFILSSEGTTIRLAENEIFKQAGFAPKTIFETSNIRTICNLAASGYAISILPSSYAAPTNEAVYFYLDTAVRWNRFAATNAKHHLSIPEQYLISLAKDWTVEKDGKNLAYQGSIG